jgi:hypothetical protein
MRLTSPRCRRRLPLAHWLSLEQRGSGSSARREGDLVRRRCASGGLSVLSVPARFLVASPPLPKATCMLLNRLSRWRDPPQ